MRSSLGRSHGRRVGAKRSAKRERIAPLVVEYVKANPNAKIQSVADLFGASTKMVWTIIAEANMTTFKRKHPKQLELFVNLPKVRREK